MEIINFKNEEEIDEEKIEQKRNEWKIELKELRKEIRRGYIVFMPSVLVAMIVDIILLPIKLILLITRHPGLRIRSLVNDLIYIAQKDDPDISRKINLKARNYLVLTTAMISKYMVYEIRNKKSYAGTLETLIYVTR